jgi:hypothetical protein
LLIKNKDQRTAPEIDILYAATGWEIEPDLVAARGANRTDRVFVSALPDNSALRVYDVLTNRVLLSLSRAEHKVSTWPWKPDSTKLLVIFDDGAMKLYSRAANSEKDMSGNHKDVSSVWWVKTGL